MRSEQALAGAWAAGWQPMTSAPRDGTIIEVMNTYGIAPWYTLARWVEPKEGSHGLAYKGTDGRDYIVSPSMGFPQFGWQMYDKINGLGWSGFLGGEHLKWRPYNGKAPEDYVDPTGGQQETINYWRGASSLPLKPIRGNPTLKEWGSQREDRASNVIHSSWFPAVVVLTIALLFGAIVLAFGADRLPCSAQPQGPDWHYRTKVPGFSGDVRDDRCWYDGPRMKPREELYWPEVDGAQTLKIKRPPTWQLEERFKGAPDGWEHKE